MRSPHTLEQNTAREVISIKEARKLLGKESDQLSDTQISALINDLQMIAKRYIEYSGSKNQLGI